MRLSIIVASFAFLACSKKPLPPAPVTQPTKVSEAEVAEPATAATDAAPTNIAPADAAAGAEPDAMTPEPTPTPAPVAVVDWMSWEGGIDFVGMTKEGLQMPNVVLHLGRMVHTPLGSAASGMVLYQPDMDKPPVVAGFVSSDANVGAYFGPKIFAGTPFEKAPATVASIEVTFDAATKTATARCKVGETLFEATLSDIGDPYLVARDPAQMTPFHQQGVEAKAGKVVFKVNGAEVPVTIPPVGLAGGPGAVWSATGVYAR